jgi:hypothetical protein
MAQRKPSHFSLLSNVGARRQEQGQVPVLNKQFSFNSKTFRHQTRRLARHEPPSHATAALKAQAIGTRNEVTELAEHDIGMRFGSCSRRCDCDAAIPVDGL